MTDHADVEIVVTNCYRPAWTKRALESIRRYYPDNRIIVIDDKCAECEAELGEMVRDIGVTLLRSPKRQGTGLALDQALEYCRGTKYVLTYDHGVTISKPGLIEWMLEKMAEDPANVAVGKRGGSNRCAKRLGPFLVCSLALYDREFIHEHELTFALYTLVTPDGEKIPSCTTGQFLCYRALKLGGKMRYVNLRPWHYHEHARDAFGKRFPSPHSGHWLEEGEIDIR